MKRIISFLLSLIFFFSLITPTLAAEKDFLGLILTSFKTERSKGSSITNASSLDGGLPDKIGSAIGAIHSIASITDSVYGSVYDSVYKNRMKRSLASQPIIPPVNLKPDESPYMINSEYDSISTLSGSLTIQTTDMTINGRNGLSFSLTRTYNSIDANMYDKGPADHDHPYDKYEYPYAGISTGWAWDLPYMQYNGEDWYIHLAGPLGSGTYQLFRNYPWGEQKENPNYAWGETYLLNYPWKNLKVSWPGEYYLIQTLEGITYHFKLEHHGELGILSKISDAYNNEIRFKYEVVGDNRGYKKLKSISTDDPSQTITIDYHSEGINLTKGEQKVQFVHSLIKALPNEFFLWRVGDVKRLDKVIDAEGRTTTYNYEIKDEYSEYTIYDPRTNKLRTEKGISQRNLLLNNITHPTGAKSFYVYEDKKSSSYLPKNHYRIKEKSLQDGSHRTFKHEKFSYEENQKIYTIIDDGLSQTRYTTERRWYDGDIDLWLEKLKFYQTNITKTSTRNGVTYTISTGQQYDEARQLPYPNKVTTTYTAQGQSYTTSTSREFDLYGNVLWSTDPMGVTTNYDYDPNTHLLSGIMQPIYNNQKRYTLLERNDKYKVTKEKVFEDGPHGKLLSETRYEDIDPYGNPRKIITKTDDAKETETFVEYGPQYHSRFPTKTSTDVTNVDGAITKITQQYEYNPTLGKVTKIIDGKGYATSYDYDKLGRVTKAVNPDNSVVTLQYNDANNSILVTDEAGVKTYTQWNPIGWKIATGVSEHDIRSRFGYDAYGRLEWSEDARGNRTWFGYDQWSRQNKITYPDGSSATVEYNDVQRTKVSTDAEGYKITETLDPLDRTTKKEETKLVNGQHVVQTLGTFMYDAAGKVRESTDGNNNRTKFDYDALGRLTGVTNAKNEFTKYEYTSKDRLNLFKIVFPDNTERSKKYDELGRTIQTIAPDQAVEKFYYDENHNLRTYVDRKGQVTTNDYDSRNKLRSSALGSETIRYDYDTAGKRRFMQDNTGTTNYHYNELGQLEILTYPDGRTIRYSYDRQGNRETMTDPFGYVTAYGYDNRNRLTGVGPGFNDWDAKYEYKRNNLLAAIVQRNGVNGTYTYEGLNLAGLSQQKHGAALNTFAYGYDGNRNQTSKTENGTRHEFSYDPLNRIGTSSQFGEQYTYDSRGNRQTLQSSSSPDLSGASYRYDERNRLVEVTTDDGKNVAYRYNGDGLLYERTENGQTVRYYYDGANMIAEGTVTNGSVALKARYIRGNGLAARADANGAKTYYLHNGHGDVVGLTDGSGNVVNRYTYDIWGNPLTVTEQVPQPFRYSGEFWDNSAHLQYLRARWYDPSVGRFMSQDTYEGDIANPLSLNLYTYGWNNPLMFSDPSGNSPERIKELISEATDGGIDSEVYWDNRSKLGAYFRVIFNDENNNQFKYLYGVATKTSGIEENSAEKADWAVKELIQAEKDWEIQFAVGIIGDRLIPGSSKMNVLKPGPHAKKSIPARGKERDFTKEERDKINEIGNDTGCHTCGSTDPGTKSGNFIPDHQPPNATVPNGTPQELYPHCKNCSSQQGGVISWMKRKGLIP